MAESGQNGRKIGPEKNSQPAQKDNWDKLGTLSPLISSVVIGAAGVAATYLYNTKELAIKHLEKEQEAHRLDKQAETAERIETTKELHLLFPYISSEKNLEREFGYAMFTALGQGDLVIKLARIKTDTAGAASVEALTRSSNPDLAKEASGLSS